MLKLCSAWHVELKTSFCFIHSHLRIVVRSSCCSTHEPPADDVALECRLIRGASSACCMTEGFHHKPPGSPNKSKTKSGHYILLLFAHYFALRWTGNIYEKLSQCEAAADTVLPGDFLRSTPMFGFRVEGTVRLFDCLEYQTVASGMLSARCWIVGQYDTIWLSLTVPLGRCMHNNITPPPISKCALPSPLCSTKKRKIAGMYVLSLAECVCVGGGVHGELFRLEKLQKLSRLRLQWPHSLTESYTLVWFDFSSELMVRSYLK